MSEPTAAGVVVYLVVDPLGGPAWAGIDRVRAHDLAGDTNRIVVELPAAADYRTDEQRRDDEMGWARGPADPTEED